MRGRWLIRVCVTKCNGCKNKHNNFEPRIEGIDYLDPILLLAPDLVSLLIL